MAIEPIIGHMKNDGLLGRNYLKGRDGDAMNVLLAAAGHNLRVLLNWLRIFSSKFRWALRQSLCRLLIVRPLRVAQIGIFQV